MTSWGAFTKGLGATFGEAVVRQEAGKAFVLVGFGSAVVSGRAGAWRGSRGFAARLWRKGGRKGGRREGARTAGAGAEGTTRRMVAERCR